MRQTKLSSTLPLFCSTVRHLCCEIKRKIDMESTKNSTPNEERINESGIPENLPPFTEPTLVANMERVVELAVTTKLGEAFNSAAQTYLAYIAERMSITEKQALLLSLFLEKSSDRRIMIGDFAQMLDCLTIRIISLMSEVDALVARGFVRRHRASDGSLTYRMPPDVVSAFKDNKVYTPESIKDLSAKKFFDTMAQFFDDYESGDNITHKLDMLLSDNMHLEFCKTAKRLDLDDDDERLLFYVFCNRFINEDDDMIGEHDWEDYFESKSTLRLIRGNMKRCDNRLFYLEIIECRNSDGMTDTNYFKLTNKAKDMLFADLDIGQQQTKNPKQLLNHTSFAEKSLFYNPRERLQIEQLSELLMPEKFASIQLRLEENGMRKGFTCLFYGSPGTGKTETVYQLARRTHRDLMVIDVSQIKSCWVGESEKNIKKAFDRYRYYVGQCERAPILLFNEADAVLGIRMEGAQRAVEKMENSIQNIILQEMEQLDGIMIATTNLTQNLDKAFERRFIYKIEFLRPSLEVRRAIWQSMIPTLAAPLAEELAAAYDFSGGQIENIARKRIVELILNGEEPSSEQMHSICRAEQLANNSNYRRRIGYK